MQTTKTLNLRSNSKCNLHTLTLRPRSRALSTKFNSSPQEASRPFDCERDGFVIGEGSGVIVLEEYEYAKSRGAKIYAELCGYGMSGDTHHITQPPEDGKGAALAMSRSLKQSGLCPNQVDYINAHATSTPIGVAVEARAMKTVFSEHASSGTLAFSSTKGATGHLLGAAGAVEAIFSILPIHHGLVPPTLNVKNPDPIFNQSFMPSTASKRCSLGQQCRILLDLEEQMHLCSLPLSKVVQTAWQQF